MNQKGGNVRKLSFSKMFFIASVFCAATTIAASSQTLTTLVNFNGTDGDWPTPGVPLVQATDGNLYGVTYYGGTPTSCRYSSGTDCGTFFKITPAGELTTLYSFCSQSNCADGQDPVSLLQAPNGNFYGVTFLGGANRGPEGYGFGTIFEMTPSGVLTTLYTFCSQTACSDGEEPQALVVGVNGNLYGTTALGGAYNNGTVFEINAAGKLTTLYSFCAKTGCPDGGFPGALMQASDGNLYGSTQFGGAHNGGVIFEITPAGKFATLYSFVHGLPNAMIEGGDGNLYGTTGAAGTAYHGTVFKLTLQGDLTVIHNFCEQGCATGDSPLAGLVQGSDGNFYGTTYEAGNTYYAGSVFGVAPTGAFATLYLFCSQTNCSDGDGAGALMQATNGTFYGTTVGGGTGSGGTVYSLSTGLGPFVAARPNFGTAGQVITILGNNLTGATSVTFNGTSAKFKVVSDTYIEAAVPAGASAGMIEVTTPSGTVSSNVAFLGK
jgi:uncharacterized repeat protein (TIGR03803 family)